MTTQEIAEKLVQHCREGKFEDAVEDFYANNIVSYEAPGMPDNKAEGLESVKAKGKQWLESVVEVHSMEISDPLVGGPFFSVCMKMDITYKQHGRGVMEEIAVYEVKDGKIVSERFFYQTQ